LITDLYRALDVVSRELVGFIPAVTLDSGVEEAAIGETVYSYVAPAATAATITPANIVPDNGNQTFGNKTIAISKARYVPIRWNGDETKQMDHASGWSNMRDSQFQQAFRTLTNEMETDLASLNDQASRAYGDGGTTPFASTLADTAQLKKILDDNGAPPGDRSVVMDTTAGAAMRTLTQLSSVDSAGDSTLLRQGVLLNVHGFNMRESAQVEQLVTIGDSDGNFVTDSAGYAVGATSIVLAVGADEILVGDVIRFTGDTNQYVVATGIDGPGTIVIHEPGLRQVIAASPIAVTSEEASTRNMAFSRNAMVLATRAPAKPNGPTLAVESEMIQDPRTGMAFELNVYPLYHSFKYELGIVWGFGNMKPEHTALLLG
jgi:hypothetical protein